MPIDPAAAVDSPAAAPLAGPAGAVQLAAAGRALWVARPSLTMAFMHTGSPVHRYLLSRRIARNFDALARQECFDTGCRASCGRLADRWQARPERLAPEPASPARRRGLLQFLF